MKNEKLYQNYADINSQIKNLEEQKKELGSKLLKDMEDKEVDQLKSNLGTFSLVERKTWKYSDDVKAIETSLKSVKKEEVESGKAKSEVSKSLRFQGINN